MGQLKVDPRNTFWMEKKWEKYLHQDTQNEIIRLMAFIIIRYTAKNIKDSIFYSIMANEVTDCGNNEQFIICFRLVDAHDTQGFGNHKDFLGIYNVDNMKAVTLLTVTKKKFSDKIFSGKINLDVFDVIFGRILGVTVRRKKFNKENGRKREPHKIYNLRILTGKKHPKIRLSRLRKIWIWTFGSLVHQINS